MLVLTSAQIDYAAYSSTLRNPAKKTRDCQAIPSVQNMTRDEHQIDLLWASAACSSSLKRKDEAMRQNGTYELRTSLLQ